MIEHNGKICPYCKTEFLSGDEIVLCGVCEMPHHKDCWIENQGCTTFGCLGTMTTPSASISFAAAENHRLQEKHKQSFVYCSSCGAPNYCGKDFCGKCGAALVSPNSTVNYEQFDFIDLTDSFSTNIPEKKGLPYKAGEALDDGEITTSLIGSNVSYYRPAFEEIRNRESKGKWNWAAFLFTPFWMIYRKMYGYGFASLAAMYVCYFFGGWFFSLISLAGHLLAGFYGNSLYLSFLQKKAMKLSSLKEPYKTRALLQERGSDTVATVLTVICYFFLAAIVEAFSY